MSVKKKSLLLLLPLVIIQYIFGLSFLIHPEKTYAAGTAEWIDNATIKYDGRLFRDEEIDTDWNFLELEVTDGCQDKIDAFDYDPDSENDSSSRTPGDDKVTYHKSQSEGGSCGTTSKDDDITLTKPERAQFGFKWINKTLIMSADERRQFFFDDAEDIFINSTNEDDVCKDIIHVGSSPGSVELVVKRGRTGSGSSDSQRRDRLRSDYDGYTFVEDIDYDKETNDGRCISSDPLTVKANDPGKSTQTPAAGDPTSGSIGEDAEPSCESEGGGLGWILCSVLGLLDNVISYMDDQINSLLRVPDPYLQDPGIQNAWRRIRNIAYIILIPIMLVMVISTALGFEFVSAYTVKRALPRLFAAVLFITLSYPLCVFLITLTNNVGGGIFGLITSGVNGADTITVSELFHPDGQNLGAGFLVGVAGGAAILAAGSIGILFSYALVAFVGILIGFIALAFRQFLIIGLLLLAPIAILAWIFPGNDKLWKLWWGSFSKLLMLFPIIMILIASGRSFAAIIQEVAEQPGDAGFQGAVATLLKLIAYVGPYFFIPATFKFAGGIFATVSGMANDRSKGLFDRQRKYRSQKAGQNYHDWKAGEKSWRPQAFNRLGERVGVGAKGFYGVGARGEQARAQLRAENSAKKAKSEQIQALALNSDDGIALMFATGGDNSQISAAGADLERQLIAIGTSAPDAARRRADAEARVRAVGVNRSNAMAAGQLMMQNKARSVAGGAVGAEFINAGLARMHGRDTTAAEETRGTLDYFARESGRADLGNSTDGNGNIDVIRGFDRTGAYKAIRGHTTAVQSFSDALTAEYNTALNNGDSTRAIEAASKLTAMRGAMGPDVSEDNKAILTAALQGVGIDIGDPRTVDEQFAERITTHITPQIGPPVPGEAVQTSEQVSSHIRNRAGLYEQGDPARRGGWGPNNPSDGA